MHVYIDTHVVYFYIVHVDLIAFETKASTTGCTPYVQIFSTKLKMTSISNYFLLFSDIGFCLSFL